MDYNHHDGKVKSLIIMNFCFFLQILRKIRSRMIKRKRNQKMIIFIIIFLVSVSIFFVCLSRWIGATFSLTTEKDKITERKSEEEKLFKSYLNNISGCARSLRFCSNKFRLKVSFFNNFCCFCCFHPISTFFTAAN